MKNVLSVQQLTGMAMMSKESNERNIFAKHIGGDIGGRYRYCVAYGKNLRIRGICAASA